MRPCARRVQGDRGVYVALNHTYQWYNCFATLHLGCVSGAAQRTEFGGRGTPENPPAPIAASTVDGEPDIVRLLPNYSVPYRDRSPNTTRRSYGLESLDVHPNIPPAVPFAPWIRDSRAWQCDPMVHLYLAV
jgi:hypothetical protein